MSVNLRNHTEDLVQAFQNGEEKGYDYFFRYYFTSLCFFANRFLRNEEDAKDIVQDCFVKLWNKRIALNNSLAIKSFLYTTVRNACINFMRDKRTVIHMGEEGRSVAEFIEENWLDQVTQAEMIREIHVHIQSLPTRMQEVFRKYYIEGKSCNEIAVDLQTHPATIRKQRARALTLLREKLGTLLAVLLFFL